MKRIVFVDDEGNVLNGLKRLLRPLRHEWEMSFCQSGDEALRTLADGPFDVIVSDMRMPGMDGAALLAAVMQRYPHVVRIVLSGQSSQESTVRSIGVAHQYLAKPCDSETLKQTVDRAFALRDLLSNDSLKELLARVGSVPSVPSVYEALLEELRHPDASTQRVGEIVSKDMGMTAKILQLVNSAFFGLPRRVSSPTHAAALLGMETVKALVLSVHVFTQYENAAVGGVDPEDVQHHCAATAALAKRIAGAEQASPAVADACLTAGFLHDVGRLILAHALPAIYADALTQAHTKQITLYHAEREVFGATHAEVGAYLLGLWGLPDPIVEAAAFHHAPGKSGNHSFAPLTAVHVANVLLDEQSGRTGLIEELDLAYLQRVGIADRVEAWRAHLAAHPTHGGGAV